MSSEFSVDLSNSTLKVRDIKTFLTHFDFVSYLNNYVIFFFFSAVRNDTFKCFDYLLIIIYLFREVSAKNLDERSI